MECIDIIIMEMHFHVVMNLYTCMDLLIKCVVIFGYSPRYQKKHVRNGCCVVLQSHDNSR